jgi:hypothetical protein
MNARQRLLLKAKTSSRETPLLHPSVTVPCPVFCLFVAVISTYAACSMPVLEIEEWTASPHPLAWHLPLRYPHCLHRLRRRMRD